MILSTQYYRPPFPGKERWADDLAEIARTGFDTIYLAACWSWVEPEPGTYRFDDYDELIELAASEGLRIVVNLWSETQPVWIHRRHPDASMVDHRGHAVRSSQLAYSQFGLTPGCCTDHPDVREVAGAFLSAFTRRYADHPQIRAWDCWNEMRWMSQADGYVCFCEHSIARYHAWLEARFGSLDALNTSCGRRYGNWADVAPPKAPGRSYTDSMLWQQFLTDRTCQELKWRYQCVRSADAGRPIIAHAAFPSTHNTGEYFEFETALGRGNDWQLAREADEYGCSHFPSWFHPSPAEYGARLEAGRSASGGKPYWIAELQGGAAGHGMQAMQPVPGEKQARWLWNGIARGVKAVNFWCWRDEVFGRESGGFGIVGDDGHREQRLEELARTAELVRRNEALLDGYAPAPARVGVIFEPLAYQLDWASLAPTGLAPPKDAPFPAGHSLQGYLLALERLQIPYDLVEPSYCESLDQYRLLILPWPLVVDPDLPERLVEWVRNGGTLLTEASLDAFTDIGLYRYPEERALPAALGMRSSGRRPSGSNAIPFDIEGRKGTLRPARWREDIQILGAGAEADAPSSLALMKVGNGRVLAAGSFVGLSYWEERYSDFEGLLAVLTESSGAAPDLRCSASDGDVVQWRLGYSGNAALLFVINDGPAIEAIFEASDRRMVEAASAIDLTTGEQIQLVGEDGRIGFSFRLREGGYHILRFGGE